MVSKERNQPCLSVGLFLLIGEESHGSIEHLKEAAASEPLSNEIDLAHDKVCRWIPLIGGRK
jgi:hypothetical protein